MRDVTEMTKGELSAVINNEKKDLHFVKACIKERNERTNEFIQNHLKVQRA
jgi:hypothetical protein